MYSGDPPGTTFMNTMRLKTFGDMAIKLAGVLYNPRTNEGAIKMSYGGDNMNGKCIDKHTRDKVVEKLKLLFSSPEDTDLVRGIG